MPSAGVSLRGRSDRLPIAFPGDVVSFARYEQISSYSAVIAGTGARPGQWVGLGEASAMLGITPGTLRRWADEGRVPVFTTPGGHRRFSRTVISSMLPASRVRRPPLARLGASVDRISRAYRSRKVHSPSAASWIERLDPAARVAFRERGRTLVATLLEYLDAPDDDARADRLADAKRLAAEHGREVSGLGLSMADAVEAFLRFRSPFTEALGSLARRRGLDTREATDLLSEAEAATDALLVAVMTGHSLATVARSSGDPRRPRTTGGR